MLFNECPVHLDAETRFFIKMHVTATHFGALLEQPEPKRFAFVSAMRLHCKARLRKGGDKMGMQLRRMVWRDHDAMLFGELRHAQRFGETRGAGGVELHVTDRAACDEVANSKAGEFALTMDSGIGVACASRTKSAGCRFELNRLVTVCDETREFRSAGVKRSASGIVTAGGVGKNRMVRTSTTITLECPSSSCAVHSLRSSGTVTG